LRLETREGDGDLAGELERIEEPAIGELGGERARELVEGEVEADEEGYPAVDCGRGGAIERVLGEVKRGGGTTVLEEGRELWRPNPESESLMTWDSYGF
jgi:hypothetical protein